MEIYGEELYTDSRGNTKLLPTKDPVSFRVTASEDRGSDAELPGQISSEVLRIIARDAPAGSWSRIYFRNEDWDIAAPPIFSRGLTSAGNHVQFSIRSRNGEKRIGS